MLIIHIDFWGQILGANEFVDTKALTSFLAKCQFKFGGIAKAPEERPGRR